MTPVKCEQIAIAMMAIADGEDPLAPTDEVAVHLAECAACREETEQLHGLATLLNEQRRGEFAADLWPIIHEQLSPPAVITTAAKWPAFLVLGLLLVIFKLLEMVPERDPGFVFKLLPVLLAVAVFAYVKENPFKINLELTLEGDRE